MTKTAEEWETEAQRYEAAARGNQQSAADSFDRCDTDGFVSQWASGITAQLNLAKADIARNHGKIEMRALFFLDGTIASTHEFQGEWGLSWRLNDAATRKFGKRFVSLSKASTVAKRAANNRKKGFALGRIRVDGYAELWSPPGAKGLGGATSVSVVQKPVVTALRAGDYEVLSTDTTAEDIEREERFERSMQERLARVTC